MKIACRPTYENYEIVIIYSSTSTAMVYVLAQVLGFVDLNWK